MAANQTAPYSQNKTYVLVERVANSYVLLYRWTRFLTFLFFDALCPYLIPFHVFVWLLYLSCSCIPSLVLTHGKQLENHGDSVSVSIFWKN